MDIYCPKCREPWELESLHEEVSHRFPDKPWYIENDPRCGIEFEFTHYGGDLETVTCARLKDHTEKHLPYDSDIYYNSKENAFYVQSIYSKYFSKVRKDFYTRGCEALTSFGVHCVTENISANSTLDSIYELMGDDIDGAMSMIDDAEQMGLL